jgi:hypothetical protein
MEGAEFERMNTHETLEVVQEVFGCAAARWLEGAGAAGC